VSTGTAEDTPVLVEGVGYQYTTPLRTHTVLHDVSLRIEPGEIVILTGPSGSGKTTLITLIGALRAAQSGSIRIFGRELLAASQRTLARTRREIGFIFQHHNLLDYLSVAQNVAMSLSPDRAGRERGGLRERILEVLAQVGLEAEIDKAPKALSGGQKQRVGIARALLNRPRLILADEPTASLDRESGRNVVNLIQQLCREQGASVVLVTHDNRILDVADRIFHLEDGRIQSISAAVASSTSQMLKLLDRHDPATGRYMSALAQGLTRVALADDILEDAERETIRHILLESSGLQASEVELVMQLAQSSLAGRQGAGAAGQRFTDEQGRHFLESLHAVAAADGAVGPEELAEIATIARELGLEPPA